jgi:hypothetical protein
VDGFKLSSGNSQFVDKVVDVVGLYHNPPEKCVVLCVDEESGMQALDRSPAGAADDARQARTLQLRLHPIRHHQPVISEIHRRHRAVECKKFLIAIDKAVPAELDVHLVCDNLATHKTPAIRAWL